jgi:hypothetical protein
MHIYDESTCEKFNKYFGYFHDGFIKKLEILSGKNFHQEMPWEPKKEYTNNKEKLLATHLSYYDGKLINIIISHYLYDWPNQPWNREIHIQIPHAENIYYKITQMVGIDIIELAAKFKYGNINFHFVYHDIHSELPACSIDNAHKLTLCTSKKARVMERNSA